MGNLADAFASAFFFRILLPGSVLASGFHPLFGALGLPAGLRSIYPLETGTLFLVEVSFFGLVAYAATIPIYHILHGVRFRWLTSVSNWAIRRGLKRKLEAMREIYGDRTYGELTEEEQIRVSRIHNYLHDFPLEIGDSGNAKYLIDSRTRLGCIIDRYTYYPNSRYGIDSNAFWNHLAYLTPEHVRKELDSIESIAQGMTLSAATCWAVFVSYMFVGAGMLIGLKLPELVLLEINIRPLLLIALLVCSLVGILLFNYLAREGHREFGRHFCASIDVYGADLQRWITTHQMPFSEKTLERAAVLASWSQHLEKTARDI